ncbi:hypothetical protein ES703_31873 [subsurface metagenome]
MKNTPSNCVLDECEFNTLSPGENSQECIGCLYLRDETWQPKNDEEEK